MTQLDEVRRALLSMEPGEPLLTASLDLTPAGSAGQTGSGRSTAPAVAREALRDVTQAIRDEDIHLQKDLTEDATRLGESVDEAMEEGAKGLFYVASTPRGGLHIELRTALPMRNRIHLGPRPWIFELERYRYLTMRPVSVAVVTLHSLFLHRFQHGENVDERSVQHPEVLTRFHKGDAQEAYRTRQAPGSGPGSGVVGGHGYYRVQNYVQEHRRQFARDAVGELVPVVERDDIFIVAGVDEARAQLLDELPDALRERAHEAPSVHPNEDDPRAVWRMASDLAREAQYAAADLEAQRILDGAYTDRSIVGHDALRDAITQGRVGKVVVHEDAVSHGGDAVDTRRHATSVDETVVEGLLRDALTQDAEPFFTRLPDALERWQGIAGVARF